MNLVDKQTIIVHVVLLDKLGELVRLLCVVEWVHVHDLIPGSTYVSTVFLEIRRGSSLRLILVGLHFRSHSEVECLASRFLHDSHEVLRVIVVVLSLDFHGFVC
jgi:hypothetical protein